ncbi:hypothetical protein H9L21_08355 [Aeromicrobium senzhongii]|uniref:Excinuclease ABC subunit A n=1 Tax=Aeromicrobium senzhongii TaxID=2663859 RepID=A0ABX6SXR3_9ACTN|nr:hypothetical protein [Aeromicrobium senzhongii]MTB87022.1 hypothetical protein [Aeromicrobium senzhongii]QNL96052.1 hypothetical protein H9L21_08355 [Aeromicrobium senzhongii]
MRGARVHHLEDVDVTVAVDLGPGGGVNGGRIVATGTAEQVAENPDSVTGRYLRAAMS